MIFANEYKETNTKLDEQISKLQQCKHEMMSIFSDLDNLENDISIMNSNNESRNKTNSYSRRSYESRSSSRCSCHKNFQYSSDETEEDDIDITYIRHKYHYENDYELPRKKSLSRPQSTKLTFSYKIPKNYLEPNTRLDLDKFNQRSDIYDIKRSNSVNYEFSERNASLKSQNFDNKSISKQKPKSIKKFMENNYIPRPKWVPNGKFNMSTSNQIFSSASTNSLGNRSSTMSRSTTSIGNKKPSTTKPMKTWKSSLKHTPDPAIFLSSQDLSKSLDNFKNKKYITKKKPPIDPKDIGGGWKPIYKSHEKLDIYQEIPKERENIEKSQSKVSKKVLKDEKDIGKGWKAIGKIKENDLKIYSNSNLSPTIDETKQKSKQNKIIDEKDIGKGWKPAGKIKEDAYPKHDLVDNKQNLMSVENLKVENKSLKPKSDIGNGWKPFANTNATSKPLPPTATSPSQNENKNNNNNNNNNKKPPPIPVMTKRKKLMIKSNKSDNILKNSQNKPEENVNEEKFTCSTPKQENSFNSKLNNDELLDESIIMQGPDQPEMNSFKNKSNTSETNSKSNKHEKSSNDEVLNEKVDNVNELKSSKIEDQVLDDNKNLSKSEITKDSTLKDEKLNLDESIEDKKNEETKSNKESNINDGKNEDDDDDEEEQLWNLKASDDEDD